MLSSAATIGLAVAVVVFVWRLFVLMKRRLLWRVRRKLILSYIFIGVVPSLLIIVFFLFCSAVLFMDVAAYLFKSGYDEVVDDVKVVAQAAALEISARIPTTAQQTVERVQRMRSRAVNIRRSRSSYVAPRSATRRTPLGRLGARSTRRRQSRRPWLKERPLRGYARVSLLAGRARPVLS